MNTFIKTAIFFIILSTSLGVFSQSRTDNIRRKLDSLSVDMPGLLQPVDLSVDGVTMNDFIRGLAISNNVNVAINGELNDVVENNFSGVKVIDVFVFLCDNHKLDIKVIGNIIVFSHYQEPSAVEKPYSPKKPDIRWDSADSLLSFDLQNDSLIYVSREIVQKTGLNILLAPDIRGRKVNGYIQNVDLMTGVEKLAFMNGLSFEITQDGYAQLSAEKTEKNTSTDNQKNNGKNTNSKQQGAEAGIEIQATGNSNRFNISAQDATISEIVSAAAGTSGNPCIQLTEVKDKITLQMNNVSFDELLPVILSGSSAIYKQTDSIYIIGDKGNQTLRSCRVIQFQHRSVIDLSKSIPEVFKQNITVTEFPELNSLIISGPELALNSFAEFLRDIDKNVPQVLIEVIIIDQQTSHTVKTGINAGIGDAPATTQGQLFPSTDMTLGADAINSILNSLNGFGAINLGRVTQNFYITLSAMESNGQVNIKSTPRLSTLNGTEATMSIGNTEYYLEESNNVIGSQNPQNIITKQYRSVQADFVMTILPIVHGDDQITLNITVEQSDFTGRISPSAPPGKVTRKFTSSIRIKNQEMILLGGLEEKSSDDSGEGTPVLSRIPVIKWMFSSRTKEKSKKRLSVFIRPIIIY